MLNLSLASRRLNQLNRSLENHLYKNKKWKLPDLNKLENQSLANIKLETYFQPPVEPTYLESILKTYGVTAKVKDFHIGNSVTTYEVSIPVGFKTEILTRVQGDLARDLKSPTLRLIPNLLGTSSIGIELCNSTRFPTNFKNLIQSLPSNLTLPLILGEDTFGKNVYADLIDLPHLLVAGTTGSGKSVFLNTVILTTIACKKPEDVRLLLIDPKQVEFSEYEDVPHLLEPIACSTEESINLLYKTVSLMEERFDLFREVKPTPKKLSEYNETTGDNLPYILFIVDEYADLITTGNLRKRKEIETNMARIAQKARAVGIHMIAATQKPMREVVTPLLKANLPARIAFRVVCGTDSRIILDCKGAEKLTGKGDMLFKDPTAKSEADAIKRIQATYVSKFDTDVILTN
jgi:S-DNA-T family DNA segregation ATPase FtsK/SpoIIIE